MATASVEISATREIRHFAAQIYGPCVRQESLDIGSETETLTDAVTQEEINAADGLLVARVVGDEGCWVAVGSAPDPEATEATSETTARRWLPAGVEFVAKLNAGDKVAVHA